MRPQKVCENTPSQFILWGLILLFSVSIFVLSVYFGHLFLFGNGSGWWGKNIKKFLFSDQQLEFVASSYAINSMRQNCK